MEMMKKNANHVILIAKHVKDLQKIIVSLVIMMIYYIKENVWMIAQMELS